MPTDHTPSGAPRRGPVRSPRSLASGIALVALAAFAIWAISDLPQGTLRAMGPAMLPRWLAVGVGLCGVLLLASSFVQDGEPLEGWNLRGPLFVGLAIFAFAVTIRPFPLGGFTTPGLGLIGAGPLAIFISGFASNEVRPRDLVILSLTLIPFCMLLFGDLLNLPIPIFPLAFAELFPAGWSQKAMLRALAAIMLAVGAAVILLTRRRGTGGPVDVADHSGRA